MSSVYMERNSRLVRRLRSGFFVLFFFILFLLPFVTVKANAMTIDSYNIEKNSSGQIRVYGTATPTVKGSSLGGIYRNVVGLEYDYNGVKQRVYANQYVKSSVTWTDSTAKSSINFEFIFYAPVSTVKVYRISLYDTTSGTASYAEKQPNVTLTGLTVQPTPINPSGVEISLTPNTTTPTTVDFTTRCMYPGGVPLKSMVLEYRKQGATTWSTKSLPVYNVGSYYTYLTTTATGSNTQQTLAGLALGQTYELRMRATNSVGKTGYSNTYTFTPGSASAPRNGSVVPGNGSVTYSWQAPATYNGTIVRYNIYSQLGTTTIATTTSTSATFTVTNGMAHYGGNGVEIAAVTKVDGVEVEGARLKISSSSVRAGAPARPAAPTVKKVSGNNKNITVSWTAPANNGSAITGYDLYVGSTSGAVNTVVKTGIAAGTTSYTYTWPTAQTSTLP